jgi:outer membrane protein assembly factor BamB
MGRPILNAREGVWPLIGEKVVIFNGSQKLVAVDKESGEIKWSYPVSGASPSLALSKDILYFVELGKGIVALDAGTGNKIWSKEGIYSSVIVANKMIYLIRYEEKRQIAGKYYSYYGKKYLEAYTGQEPTPRINENQEVLNIEGGKSLTLDASKSFAASGKTITKYLWDLGDGNTREGKIISYTYPKVSSLKEYQLTLTLTDNKGVSASKTIKVEVTPPDTSIQIAQNNQRFYYDLAKTQEKNLILSYTDQNKNLVYQVSTDKGKTWS